MFRIIKHIIKGYALWSWYIIWKPYRDKQKVEAQRKIDICEKCDYFDPHFRICNLCTCFMDIKVKSAQKEDCYDNRW
jgi:hypothetical protein